MLRPQGVIPGCPPAHIGGTLSVTTEQYVQGNTEGRPTQLRALDASYVAGFLDGDGSIHFQLVRQKEYRFGYYIRASVSFSQSTSARAGLETIQRLIGGGGYLRDRRTGMSDLVITSRPLLLKLLSAVEPYVIFKREHVRRALALASSAGQAEGSRRVPATSARSRRFCNPKLFEIEADLRRRCRATSA